VAVAKPLWFTKSRRAQNVDDYETWVEGGVMPTLNAFDNGDVRTTVIVFHPHYHDGARVQEETMNTLTSRMGTGGNNVSMVATIPIQGTIIGRSDTAGPQGKGYGEDGDPMYTLDSVSGHGVATLMRMREGKPGGGKGPLLSEDKSLTIATVNDQALFHKSDVRRLTPVECERLQGFPDDWTAGQSDSARYKQMGNAVAVPVVEWIIQGIVDTLI
jgi:site-specific DNA-cytosine methylase